MKKGIISIFSWYRRILSPDHGVLVKWGVKRPSYTCGFFPSCSEYGILAVEKYGTFRGLLKTGGRILRCHPFQKDHIDFP